MRAGASAFIAFAFASAACSFLVDTDDLAKGAKAVPAVPDDSGTPLRDGGPTTLKEAATTDDAYRAAVMEDAPNAYWRLGEMPPAGVAKDEVAGHDGSYVSVVLGKDGPTPSRHAAEFNGDDAHIQVPFRFSMGGLMPFSVEAWAAPDVDTQRGCHHIFTAQERGTPKRGFALLDYWDQSDPKSDPAGLMFERYASNEGRNSREAKAFFPPENVFTHIVGTYDGKNSRIYVNGQLKQTGGLDARGLGPFEPPTYIGIAEPGDCPWKGRLAEIAVYEKALTPERINAHFAAMK